MLISNKKIIIISVSIILLFLLLVTNSFAMPSPTYDFYVNDSANIINTSTEQYIINTNKKLYTQTGAQIVVVTVKSLEGKSIEEYATELFRNYGIGSKEKNNGVLLLVSTEDRKTRIEVGYGLEGRLTDGKTGRILDNYVVPYFKDNNWEDGIKNGFNAILEEVCEEYSTTIEGAEKSVSADVELNPIPFVSASIIFVICLITRHIFSGFKKWIIALRISNCRNNY